MPMSRIVRRCRNADVYTSSSDTSADLYSSIAAFTDGRQRSFPEGLSYEVGHTCPDPKVNFQSDFVPEGNEKRNPYL